MSSVEGILLVDKEPGWTSHDVVAKCRSILSEKRVGHAGTLDPDATGLLIVGVGRATRLLRFISTGRKSYEGEVVMGAATSTLDASGEVTATFDMRSTSIEQVRAAAKLLTGEIDQVPPMYSARKVSGVRLHSLARKGIEVERAASRVSIYRFDISGQLPISNDADTPGPVFSIEVECSVGTYIRVLADDLGRTVGGGAYLRNLRRTSIGTFSVDDARPVESITVHDVLPISEALRDLEMIVVDDEIAPLVANGRKMSLGALKCKGAGPWALFSGKGDAIGVYCEEDGMAKASVVFRED
ncbi:MAG TPA: tRNA pseudouridine(55) synthase TruB [Acidimicrobiales bacterium]|nr:tRNA pseudouridine(55) synthase TruB [Acidimicrobiales bacterium]